MYKRIFKNIISLMSIFIILANTIIPIAFYPLPIFAQEPTASTPPPFPTDLSLEAEENLARRLPDGTWQALLPDGEGLYRQWVDELPEGLVSEEKKVRLREKVVGIRLFGQSQESYLISQAIPPTSPNLSGVDKVLTYSQGTLIPDIEFRYEPLFGDPEIETFLENQSSPIMNYPELISTINNVSIKYGISPRVLLVLLELQTGFVSGESEIDDYISTIPLPELIDTMAQSLSENAPKYLALPNAPISETLTLMDGSQVIINPIPSYGTDAILKYIATFSPDVLAFKTMSTDYENGFQSIYLNWFGNGYDVRNRVIQNKLSTSLNDALLPFEGEKRYTGGPHGYPNIACEGIRALNDASGIDFARNSTSDPENFETISIAGGWLRGWGQDDPSGIGKYVKIEHSGGIVSQYWHLDSISQEIQNTPLNTWIDRGTLVGMVGQTGRQSAIHLHLELRTPNGTQIGWHGQTIDSYRIWIHRKPNTNFGFDYQGSATRNSYKDWTISGDCGSSTATVGVNYDNTNEQNGVDPDTIFAWTLYDGAGHVTSTNHKPSDIGGGVKDINGQPVSGATVKFSGGGTNETTTTDGSGLYSFSSVPAGPATITAVKNNAGGSTNVNVLANQSQSAPDIILDTCVQSGARVALNECAPSGGVDSAAFIADIALPDDSIVSPGQALVKTWRVKNSGTSTWTGYKLKFTGGEQMGGAAEIAIPTTAAGATVDLSFNLSAPATAGAHSGTWRIVKPDGTWVSGGQLWVKINVQTQSSNITLSADPPSPASTSQVNIRARVNNFPNLRSMRVLVDGSPICELGAPEITNCVWHTDGYATGQHAIVIEVDDWSGPSWDNPERQSLVYELTGSGVVNHAPHRPALASPYDWYVYYSGNTAQLCAQANGDPDDGDSVTDYYFDIFDSAQLWNSGWSGSNCITTAALGPYDYQWRVKVCDSHGAESEWSDSRHFTLVNPSLSISELYFQPQDGNSEQVKIRACTTGQGGIGITMRVSVNDANDGSDSGEWHIIKELGVPCFNDTDAPVWNTLDYGDGPHRVRVEAHGLQTGWNGAAVREETYTLPHRRPASPRLVAPMPPSGEIGSTIYLNSRTVTFRWDATLRATNYTLHVSTSASPKDDTNPVFRQIFAVGTTAHTVTFSQDYPTLYWQVTATNDAGTADSGAQSIGIDRAKPACTVQSLSSPTYENVFQVNWSGSDSLAGIRSFDVQFLDSNRDTWHDWLTGIPSGKTYELFAGQPGHTYSFRCRATDNASNTGDYPTTAYTSIMVDPTARPPTPWWNSAYSGKRNLTILNNMPGVTLPSSYPVHLHFDGSTTPTAAELYTASQSSPKCNDLRIVYNDTTDLNRIVQNCSSSAIDIWFRTQTGISGGASNNTSHQLYYGNAGAGAPPADPNQVWYPYREGDTTYLYFFQEGSGSTAYDSSGNSRNCSINPSVVWADSKFSHGLRFNRANYGDSRSLNCGSAIPLSSFSIDFWYKPDNDDGGRIAGELSGGGNGGGGNNWVLQNESGQIRLDVWPCPTCGSSNVKSDFNLRNAPYAGKWNHVAVTFNGGNEVKFYVNGTLDSTKYLSQSGLNSYTPTLEIGSAEGISQIKGNLGAFRISSGVKTSFPYGAFAAIINEPTTAAGNPVDPPATGSPDLTVLNLTAYPNPDGGTLVETMVQNHGNLDTQNGFYTDLYLNHLPTGANDYSNSIQFWINDPIAAGTTVTLTTVITDLAGLGGLSTLDELGAMAETSATLYSQVDSTGAVGEPDNVDNIYSVGIEICTATADTYESDDDTSTTNLLALDSSQIHNFDILADEDWLKIQVTGSTTYTISTSDLGLSADTYLYLYDTDGTTLLAANDDSGGTLASQIEWAAPATGVYYVAIKHWNPNVSGCGTGYTVSFNEKTQPGSVYSMYLPIILKNHQ